MPCYALLRHDPDGTGSETLRPAKCKGGSSNATCGLSGPVGGLKLRRIKPDGPKEENGARADCYNRPQVTSCLSPSRGRLRVLGRRVFTNRRLEKARLKLDGQPSVCVSENGPTLHE